MIRVEQLRVRRGATTLLSLDHLEVQGGERLLVRGENGSGKSTLLRVLSGFEKEFSGRVENTLGTSVFVHQNPYLFRGSVRSNIEFGLRAHGVSASERDRRLQPLIEGLALSHLIDRRPEALSGGERRRTALARALVIAPAVLLLDEPFSDLDPDQAERLERALETLSSTIIVTSPRLLDGLAGFRRVDLNGKTPPS